MASSELNMLAKQSVEGHKCNQCYQGHLVLYQKPKCAPVSEDKNYGC